MELIFTSRNRSFFESFSKIFCSGSDSIVFYDEILELFIDLISRKISADIIIIDGIYFINFKNFTFCLLKDFENKIPAVFIDLKILKKLRVAKWISEIELCFDSPTQHNLIPLLEKINRIIDLPACAKTLNFNKNKKMENRIELPLKSKILLSPVNYQLYDYFFKNRKKIVYLDEIAEILKIRNNIGKKFQNKIYAYISNFRKSIAGANCRYELLRICKGGYQLVLKR